MQKKIILYTDGGSRNNPGPAAIGVYIETFGKKYGVSIGIATNNEAEYGALLFGLKRIKALVGKTKAKKTSVECRMDSELIVRQLTHKYKVGSGLQRYFLEAWNLVLDFSAVTFVHVPREKNTVADSLVNKALDEKEKQVSLL